ncbi:hypothetical protein WJX74_008412 [Apatococcus lobatus]|uniref:Minichromosome loss protein Mcl1 middle region domain-containing protein n=1 Tax=Apatococcus lobatus TaxID=904363 RepID=A0AAW1RGL2_9CHLO
MGGIGYAVIDGKQSLVTCGASGTIRISKDVKTDIKSIDTNCPLECLAVSPLSDVVVVGDKQYVKSYKLPSGEFVSMATRFPMPVRQLAFSPSGSTLAAAGDDETIKLVSLANEKVFRTLRTTPYIRGLAYDPDSSYLATASADGHLQVWDIATGKAMLSRRRNTPKIDVAGPGRCGLAWHPDGGSLLAAAGTENDIVCLERLSWDEAFVLKGTHAAAVNVIAFSPNGLYMASAGRDKKLVVWDMTTKKPLVEQMGAQPMTALAWQPGGNCLAGFSEAGETSCWQNIIPGDKPSPSAALDTLDLAAPIQGNTADGDTKDKHEGSMDNSMEDFIEDDVNGDFTSDAPGGKPLVAAGRASSYLPRPQGPIQPASTPAGGPGSRRWMAYTLQGCISTQEADGYNTVEVAFHDTSRSRKRIPVLNDFYRFHLASMSEKGALYASNASPDSPAMLVYRPFEAWAPNSDWSLPLPETERPMCLAAGRFLLALATSTSTLRLFSLAGIQTNVMSMPGPVVAIAAHEHLLAVVWHAGMPFASGSQCLHFSLLDAADQTQLGTEGLGLSPGATLAWMGFTDDGVPATYDSKGVMRLRIPDFGGSWMIVFDSAAEQKNKESFWPVAITRQALLCIICREHTPHPAVSPRPTMSRINLHVPVLGAAEATGPLEDQQLLLSASLSHVREAASRSAGSTGVGTSMADVQLAETEADRVLLRLFQAALKANRLLRAYELATRLHLMRSLEGSLKLANHHQVPALAERITAVIDARLALETAEEMALADDEMPEPPSSQARHEEEPADLPAASPSPPPRWEPVSSAPAPARPPLSANTFLGRQSAGGSSNPAEAKRAPLSGGSTSTSFAKRPAGNAANPFARPPKSQKS